MFTSIPTCEAKKVIKDRLKKDKTLPTRCELNVDQLVTLLELCLDTTYFMFEGQFYRQTHGAAMGSPVSPIVANLYMENFEEKALSTTSITPDVWLRYVDDTFTVLQKYDVSEFTEHINNIDKNIKFTIEEPENNAIAFLDTKVTVKNDGSTKIQVYRKPTHTDQYLNWDSNHPLEHKRSVIRTLMGRADQVVSEEQDKEEEKEHVKKVLKCNGYKNWAMKIPSKKETKKDLNVTQKERKHTSSVGIPYIQGLSEQLQRIFKKHGVSTYHKPTNKLREILVKPKDKTPMEQQSGVVYQLTCDNCDKMYIGETSRSLGTRYKEHTAGRHPRTAVGEHLDDTGHKCSLKEAKILDKEDQVYRRRIKEAIRIHQGRPELNRDTGLDIPAVILQLVSHDPEGSCDTNGH